MMLMIRNLSVLTIAKARIFFYCTDVNQSKQKKEAKPKLSFDLLLKNEENSLIHFNYLRSDGRQGQIVGTFFLWSVCEILVIF